VVVTTRDVEKMALSMPQAVKELRDDDRPAYLIERKLFCFHRTQRKDAVDDVTGERLNDVIVFRVADEAMKSMWLAARPDVYFTTDHFNGHASILTRIPFLAEIDTDELFELVSDAWLACAPKRLARQWIAEQGLDGASD
jgi:hypothetical protein